MDDTAGSGPAITRKSLNMRAAESVQCGVEAKSRAKMLSGPRPDAAMKADETQYSSDCADAQSLACVDAMSGAGAPVPVEQEPLRRYRFRNRRR